MKEKIAAALLLSSIAFQPALADDWNNDRERDLFCGTVLYVGHRLAEDANKPVVSKILLDGADVARARLLASGEATDAELDKAAYYVGRVMDLASHDVERLARLEVLCLDEYRGE